jgi:hypothetical protein
MGKKGEMHFGMCSFFLSFLFLQKLQVTVVKLIVSHENEKMMPETTSKVENGPTNVEPSSQKAANELKVSSKENMTEDQKLNNFLTTMEEIANVNDLKDFFDPVLLNHVINEEDEKEIASIKDESSPSYQG